MARGVGGEGGAAGGRDKNAGKSQESRGGGSGASGERGTASQQQDRKNQANANKAGNASPGVSARGFGQEQARNRNLNAISEIASGPRPTGLNPNTGKANPTNKGDSKNRPSGPFQTARYSDLMPNGNLPATGVGAGIGATIDGMINGAYSRYGEPDLPAKDITPQDVDALGSNMGGTGAGQDRGRQWLDQARTPRPDGRPVPNDPQAPAMTIEDYLNELRTNYIDPNSRYYLEQRGLIDPSAPEGIPAEWAPIFSREFDRIKNTLPGDLVGEKAKEADIFNQLRNYYSDQFGKNALDAEELRRRNDFSTQLNQKGWRNQLTDAFGDTSDDSIIESIINPQYQSAQDILTNQQKRGTLTNSGYDYALKTLGEKRNAANTKLQGIGAGQRATLSGDVADYLDEIYGKAGNYKLGEQFDPNSFDTEFGNRLNSAKGSLEGGIRSAAPSNLFDTGEVLSNAGNVQGQTSRGGLLDTLANRRSRSQNRGLGTTGAF